MCRPDEVPAGALAEPVICSARQCEFCTKGYAMHHRALDVSLLEQHCAALRDPVRIDMAACLIHYLQVSCFHIAFVVVMLLTYSQPVAVPGYSLDSFTVQSLTRARGMVGRLRQNGCQVGTHPM